MGRRMDKPEFARPEVKAALDRLDAGMAETIDEVRAMLLAAIDARGIEAIYDPDQLERIRRLRREDKSSYLQVFQKFLRLGGKDDHLKQALANGAATQEAARAPNG